MKKYVYLNHDGGVDDLISLFLLLQMDEVELVGVGVTPADSYLEPAQYASRKIIDRFGHGKKIEVALSSSRPVNPFPKEWRMHAFHVDAFPVLNEFDLKTGVVNKPAHLHLVETLKASQHKITLLFVGPLTDLARALYLAPEIVEKIEKLVWMGGSFLEKGNVEEPEHDGTAEWNAFWDPKAVAIVWNTNIPIDLVALESTKKVPLTNDIRKMWAKQRQYLGVEFLGQCYAVVPPLEHFETNSTYYLWDVLTTATIGYPELVKKMEVKSTVITSGQSQGRTELNPNGRPVQLVYDVNHDEFFDYITNLAKKAHI